MKEAHCLLEYSESREGYWTSEKFMLQIEHASEIADVKYPKEEGWKAVWVFHQSSCHKVTAVDASKTNVNRGGGDNVWATVHVFQPLGT